MKLYLRVKNTLETQRPYAQTQSEVRADVKARLFEQHRRAQLSPSSGPSNAKDLLQHHHNIALLPTFNQLIDSNSFPLSFPCPKTMTSPFPTATKTRQRSVPNVPALEGATSAICTRNQISWEEFICRLCYWSQSPGLSLQYLMKWLLNNPSWQYRLTRTLFLVWKC